MLPNLEHLKLRRLKNLSAILEGIVPKRGCLGMLKTLEVVDCGRLEKQLISFSFLRQLKNLEEIKVGECRRIKRLIAGSASNSELPKLKIIEMWDMVNLKGVCTRTVHLPVLERIGVSNCSLLVKLPITAYNAAAIKEIRGELEWWNNITWQDYEIKSLVQRRFQACAVSTSLGKEERSIILHLKQLFSLFLVLKLFLLIIDCCSIFKKNVVS
jgi:disease resistance protein RPS2